MKYVTETKHVPLGFGEIAGGALDEQAVTLKGAVHSLRAMGGITFLALRVRDGAVQCVCRPEELPEGLCDECAVELTGTVREESRAPGGHEIAVETLTVLRKVSCTGCPVSRLPFVMATRAPSAYSRLTWLLNSGTPSQVWQKTSSWFSASTNSPSNPISSSTFRQSASGSSPTGKAPAVKLAKKEPSLWNWMDPLSLE